MRNVHPLLPLRVPLFISGNLALCDVTKGTDTPIPPQDRLVTLCFNPFKHVEDPANNQLSHKLKPSVVFFFTAGCKQKAKYAVFWIL